MLPRRAILALVAGLTVLFSGSPVDAKRAEDVVSAPEPDPEAVLAEIPFEADSPSHRIYINLAKAGSRPLILLLDTGAQTSFMSPRVARALGVSVKRDRDRPYRRGTLLGRDLQFWVDTSSSDSGGELFEYGLLGGNFLEEYVVELDFPRRRVRFLNRRKYKLPKSVSAENEIVMRIQIAAKRPMIPIEYGGKKVSTLLDTGAPGALLLSGAAADKIGFPWRELPADGRVYSIQGATEARSTTSDEISIGGFRSTGMPLLVAPRGFFNWAGNTDSIVGFDWMKQFVIRIDYRGSRIWLRREVEVGETEWLDWGKIFAEEAAESPEDLPDPDTPLTSEEKQNLREEAARNDQAQLERWTQDAESAVYVETRGGWMRVDGYRKRLGPKEGEVWVSFEEMKKIKAERAVPDSP